MLSAFNSWSALRRLARDRAGASALEMAMIMPVLFAMLIGVMELGRYVFTVQSLRTVTAEAARMAVVDRGSSGTVDQTTGNVVSGGAITSCTNSSSLSASATKKTPFINNSALTLCISNSSTSGFVTIQVNTQYPFNSPMPVVSFLNGTLSDSTTLQYRSN